MIIAEYIELGGLFSERGVPFLFRLEFDTNEPVVYGRGFCSIFDSTPENFDP